MTRGQWTNGLRPTDGAKTLWQRWAEQCENDPGTLAPNRTNAYPVSSCCCGTRHEVLFGNNRDPSAPRMSEHVADAAGQLAWMRPERCSQKVSYHSTINQP